MSNGYTDTKAYWPRPYALGKSRSGRVFVISAVVAIAAISGTLFLVFREWRARHRVLAEFGAKEVAPIVDPLTAVIPPGVKAKEWRRVVEDTREMLIAATGSGMMDRPAMEGLRDDLRAQVARSTEENVQAELRGLWDDMQKKFGPVLTGRPSRPPFCPPRPKLLAPASTPK